MPHIDVKKGFGFEHEISTKFGTQSLLEFPDAKAVEPLLVTGVLGLDPFQSDRHGVATGTWRSPSPCLGGSLEGLTASISRGLSICGMAGGGGISGSSASRESMRELSSYSNGGSFCKGSASAV